MSRPKIYKQNRQGLDHCRDQKYTIINDKTIYLII